MGMADIIFAQLGLDRDQVMKMATEAGDAVKSADARLAKIETLCVDMDARMERLERALLGPHKLPLLERTVDGDERKRDAQG